MALLVQVGRDVLNKTALYGVGIVNIRGKEGDRIEIPWAQRVHGSDVEWPLGHLPLVHDNPRLGAVNFFEYPVRDGSGLGDGASLAEVLSGV